MMIAIASILMAIALVGTIGFAAYKALDWVELRIDIHWVFENSVRFLTAYPLSFGFPLIAVFAGIINYLFTKRTTARMDAVLDAVLRIQKSEYNVLLPNGNGGPLGELEKNINSLAIQISDTLDRRKEIEESKDDFIVNIAHDLRTPLTSIIGYLTFIGDEQLEPDISAKYAGVALKKSQQLESLIESLFDIAHLTIDAIEVNKEELNLNKFLLQKQDELYPQLHVADMELRMEVPGSISTIQADGALLARAFDNLINNAVRYAKEGRFIDIEAESLSDKVRISFITHANPVPADELERIFDKLYRLEKSRDTRTGGTGLGLSISRRVIEMHGGTLTARQAGNGTAFDIYLPK
jgi:signal transduction histidine kinase